MKIKKTISGLPQYPVSSVGKTAQAKSKKDEASTDKGDKVSISVDALVAAETSETNEVSSETQTSGPLPDPMATSQAILEKELAALFREIYL